MAIQVPLQHPSAPQGPAPPPSLIEAASSSWVRRLAQIINSILGGQLNVTLPVTLAANAPTTEVIDARISAFKALLFSPLTLNAANEVPTLYVMSQTNGAAVLAHSNGPQTDRDFMVVIIG